MNLRGEVECFDWRVEREVREVGVAPGEGRHPLTMSGPGLCPELLASPEQPPVGDLHVESPVALVANNVVQLLPLTDRAGQGALRPERVVCKYSGWFYSFPVGVNLMFKPRFMIF